MELGFTEEFIQESGLTEDQITKVGGFLESNFIPELKKGWDGKANENAEGILGGVHKSLTQKYGIELERDQGEKWADFIGRYSDNALESKVTALTLKEKEIEGKLANFKGSDELKLKYEKTLSDLDLSKQKLAKLEPLEGLDLKYKEATDKLTNMQKEVAYSSIKPTFPSNVNKYEADAKWNEWKSVVESKFKIELIDGKPIAIDKENEHKKISLSELLETDVNIKELLKGRQQSGNGARSAEMIEVEGLPFDIPKDLNPNDRANMIREYLLKQGVDRLHANYGDKYAEINNKILNSRK